MFNDKVLVILCTTGIAITAMLTFGFDSNEIVIATISGLFGVAVGKATNV